MSTRSATTRHPGDRRARPGLEALEGRALLSGGGAKGVPFRGHVSASYSFVPVGMTGELVVNYRGTEQSARFSALTTAATYTVDARYIADFTHERESVSGVGFTLTAADGSTLSGTYSATTRPTRDASRVSYLAREVITGGTGTFLRASGRITSRGVVDLTNLQVVATDTGVVRIPRRS